MPSVQTKHSVPAPGLQSRAMLRGVAAVIFAVFVWNVVVALSLAAGNDVQAKLTVVDEKGETHEFSDEDLAKLPRRSVNVTAKTGEQISYEGVDLSELLTQCGTVLGHELRGPRVASVVLLEAKDNYRVVLALPEIDPEVVDKIVLLADRRDGAPLDEKEGPFRLIIPGEKRQVRWIRMITRIRVRPVTAD